MKIIIYFLLLIISGSASGQSVTTVVGSGTPGLTGDGGLAISARVSNPSFITFDRKGNYYYVEQFGSKVRKISLSDTITTIAGTGMAGFSGDSGMSMLAKLKYPQGVACDSNNNIYVADHQNYRIRKIDAGTSIITTFAGNGSALDSGDGGLAVNASFFPDDIHFDSRGNLYISAAGHNKIRRVDKFGFIHAFCGSGVPGFSGDSSLAISAQIWAPSILSIDSKDNLYFVDRGNKRIRKVDTFGIITTIAGTGFTVYAGDGINARDANIDPVAIAIDHFDNIFISDSTARIRMIDTFGIIHTVVGTGVAGYNGDGLTATSVQINYPAGLAFDSCNNLYFIDGQNYRIRKVTFDSTCSYSVMPLSTSLIPPDGTFMYPNPTTTSLTITLPTNITTISIINLLGQTVYTNQWNAAKVEVDVSTLSAGVYVLRINGEVFRRFVKE